MVELVLHLRSFGTNVCS